MMLFHYTCDHSVPGIQRLGTVLPMPQFWGGAEPLVWMTDLDVPDAAALGLTSVILSCDRTAHRFVIDEPVEADRYVAIRRDLPPAVAAALEAGGAMPMHWYVSTVPQAARLG